MTDTLHVVCPHCAAVNRLPAARLGENPSCGQCRQALFAGQPLDLTLPLATLAPQLASFSLSELLPASVYDLVGLFVDSAADPVELAIPTLDFGAIGGSVPLVDQFLDLLKVLPSEVRLYDPTLSATLLGQALEYEVPLTTLVDTLDTGLGTITDAGTVTVTTESGATVSGSATSTRR